MSNAIVETAVVIASAGRSAVLTAVLEHIMVEVEGVDLVVVCVPDTTSRPQQVGRDRLVVLEGPRGAAAQRNHAIRQLPDSVRTVFFFDDDCFPDSQYVRAGLQHLAEQEQCVGITGFVIYDGAASGAIDAEEGLHRLATGDRSPSPMHGIYGLYGCNFAVRRSAVDHEWFDDHLPLYSWLEDEDLSRRLNRVGRLDFVPHSRCVHLGAPSGGRTSHLRYGYSQIMNAVYLAKKGSITWRRTAQLLTIAVGANVRGLGRPDRSMRTSRLRGNVLALGDVIRGRITPGRIVSL